MGFSIKALDAEKKWRKTAFLGNGGGTVKYAQFDT
jgi:hypothetical protein